MLQDTAKNNRWIGQQLEEADSWANIVKDRQFNR